MRIAELRRRLGWSQERLLAELEHHARRLGRAVPARNSLLTKLSRWENGHNVPDDVARELLCAALGCSEDDLGVGESSAPVGGLEPPASTTSSAAITPDTLQIYTTLLGQYAQLDAIAGPRAAIGPVREQLSTLEGLLHQASAPMRPALAELAARYAELGGWLAQDTGDAAAAAAWSSKAADLAALSGKVELTSYVAMRRSNVATDAGKPHDGLLLADGALVHEDRLPADLQALAYRQHAHAHALLGDELRAGRAIDLALETAVHGTDASGIAPYCGVSYLQSEGASAWVQLGRPDRAVVLLEDALRTWPADQARDRGIGLARLARAVLLADDLERACTIGHQAADAVQAAPSARAVSELEQLRTALRTRRNQPTVAELSDRLRLMHL
ncbi:hypothetical protein [Saccharopolyspora sp. NPDC049357]|uniref:helix-turn-helix domain-containing protein n=1 Tax=Saccharopolyspora sp. NPDC049357 TaxID=3154507 RepID=UPI0034199B84